MFDHGLVLVDTPRFVDTDELAHTTGLTLNDFGLRDAMLEHDDIALALLEDDGALNAEFASKLQSAGARTVVTNAREMSEEHEAALRAADCADVWRKPVEISDLYVRVLSLLPKQ